MEDSGKVRILIAEDHEVFRLGIKELINHEPDLYVCGEADDVGGSLKLIKDLIPDMAIIDITLKNSNGIDLIRKIDALGRNIRILVLSMHDEFIYAERALQSGAHGYLMKQETSKTIIRAIRQILKGNVFVSQNVMSKFLNRVRSGNAPLEKSPIDTLSEREFMVLRMIGEGRSTGEIAEMMHLSVRTISTYRERVKEKLRLKNASELVRYALHWVDNN
jgi:DNA-binding NarL/FixJ family response regulator